MEGFSTLGVNFKQSVRIFLRFFGLIGNLFFAAVVIGSMRCSDRARALSITALDSHHRLEVRSLFGSSKILFPAGEIKYLEGLALF